MQQNDLRDAVAYPADFAARYREKGYCIGRNLSDFLRESAEKYPENIEIYDTDQSISYW